MGADFLLVVRWWGTLFLLGAAAYPLARVLFPTWFDRGYMFGKAIGMAAAPWIVYVLGTARVLPFSAPSLYLSLLTLFFLGLLFNVKSTKPKDRFHGVSVIAMEEIFFFAALLFWSWIKGHEPSIRGLEKFMDYGFMKSILESRFFPPADMWYAGQSINYYYFGHLVTGFLTKLSGIDLAYTFNLMLATLFALTLTMSFSIGYQISNRLKVIAGILTAFLVTLAGNMQTLYAFTRGYTGENVQPFWKLAWGIGEFWTRLPEGLDQYWYANATRFIPFTIHEFPSYSFVVSDVHGHVLSLPFVLLAIALLFSHRVPVIFYGFLCGVLLMTNALDGPIYLGLFLIVSSVMYHVSWKKLLLAVGVAGTTSLPFLWHFRSFVSGLAVNCPPSFLANTKIGPILFEGVEKCQHSPLWMLWLLWGFFVYCGLFVLHLKTKSIQEKLLKICFVFSLLLISFAEAFYFKDIYPTHFRSNTMFKLGYEAFILFSIISAYAIARAVATRKKLFLLILLPQLFLVSIYPLFSVRSYFAGLRQYEGLYGLSWLAREYPDDYAAIEWLNREAIRPSVIVEADGDSYTDFERFSAFTGMPTIVGWSVHEWLWRGSYEAVSPRKGEVRVVYESEDLNKTMDILMKYDVRYVVVGALERRLFTNLQENKFVSLGDVVFQQGETTIYEVAIR